MNGDVRLAGAALCCFAAAWALGAYVAHRPLAPLDVESIALRGRGTRLAVLFTRSGYWPALTGMCMVVAAAELTLRGSIAFALVLGGVQLVAQGACGITKAAFKRIRPDDWLYHRELGFSFPSGHAATAALFYGGVLLFVWTASLPLAIGLLASIVPAIIMVGIPWSRMVLSAHYATDVIGGLIFGTGWFCLLLLVLGHFPAAHIFF